jgi:hypothetical protein
VCPKEVVRITSVRRGPIFNDMHIPSARVFGLDLPNERDKKRS